MGRETTFAAGGTFIYFILSFIGIMHHELWLDESHHWLLARDSASIAELFINTSREGHPVLWSLMLYLVTRFTSDPLGMQMMHIIISAVAVFIFLWKAPFDFIFKLLFVFGYFMFFEYNLIGRNYVLGVLFLFLACSAIGDGQKFILIAIYCALLANVHLMFVFISIPLFIFAAIADIKKGNIIRENYWGYIIFFAALAALSWQILRTDSAWFFTSLEPGSIVQKASKGFISLFKGLAAFPDFRTIHFWNSNLFIDFGKTIPAIIGAALYGLPLILLDKKQSKLFAYIAIAGLQVFFFVTQRAAVRFDGALYMIIIASIWLDKCPPGMQTVSEIKIRFRKVFLLSVVLLQFCSGLMAYYMDFKYPFTGAKIAVEYLRRKRLLSRDVLSVTCDGTMISPYLEKKVFFLCNNKYMSFCNWDFKCAENITQSEIKNRIGNFMQSHDDAIFISGYAIDNARASVWKNEKDFRFRFLAQTGNAILSNTSFYIYEISKQ